MGDNSNLVTVNCPSHNQVLAIGLWRAFAGQHGVDIDICWNGRTVRAHRLIAELFLSPEKLNRTVASDAGKATELPGTSTSSLDSLVEFLYSGTVVVPRDRLDELLEVAKELDFRMLADAVETAAAHEQSDNCSDDGDNNQHFDYPTNGAGSDHEHMTGEYIVNDGPVPVECRVLLEEADDSDVIDWESAEFEWEKGKKPSNRRAGLSACESIGIDSDDDCEMEADAVKPDAAVRRLPVIRPAGRVTDPPPKSPPERGWRVRVQGMARVRAKSRGGVAGDPAVRVYRCPRCSFRTEKGNSYYYHLRTVHCITAKGKPASRFDCPLCDFTSLFRNQTAGHVRTKHGIEGWSTAPDDLADLSQDPSQDASQDHPSST